VTKTREPRSFEAAAMEIANDLGVSECARIADVGPSSIRGYTDPDRDQRPTIHKALLLDAEHMKQRGTAPFLTAYAAQLRELAPQGPQRAVGDLVMEALDVPEEVGRLIGLIRRARELRSPDGCKLSPAERGAIGKELKAVRDQLDDIEEAVRRCR
jgi:hypothetical protein